jgi:hypothetical protein
MRQTCEFRVIEKFASRLFSKNEGRLLSSGIIRRIELPDDDPRLPKIAELQRELNEIGESFFLGWDIHRHYSRQELDSAEALQLIIAGAFEPAGEECGTTYNDRTSCDKCGAGGDRTSPLILDLRNVRRDIAKSIADEIVVSTRLAELMRRERVTGVSFARVYVCGQIPLVPSERFCEPLLRNTDVVIAKQTRVGSGMFGRPDDDQYRCPRGDLLGLGLLSELWVEASSLKSEDIAATRQFVGVRRGLLRPRRCLLIRPKVARILRREKISGYKLEVAHLTN